MTPSRAVRRMRHRLVPWPKHKPMPFRGLKLGAGQRVWGCSCDSGWMTITSSDPAEAHAQHVTAFGEQVAV